MSEAPNRRRGRPRVLDPEILGAFRKGLPTHSERQLQTQHYAYEAMTILDLLPQAPGTPQRPPTWLVDWEGATRRKMGAVKWSILEQLGRMACSGVAVDTIRQFAHEIEKDRPSTKEGAERLRRVRGILAVWQGGEGR